MNRIQKPVHRPQFLCYRLSTIGIRYSLCSKATECTPGVNVAVVRLLYVELLLNINDCTFPSKYSTSRKGTSKKKKAYHYVHLTIVTFIIRVHLFMFLRVCYSRIPRYDFYIRRVYSCSW